MINLFDSSSEEEGSLFTRESRETFSSQDINNINIARDEPDDVTTFTVATVLLTKQPAEPIQSNNKTNAIIDAEEERDKLRITSSLMDEEEESTDSDNDGEVTTSVPAHKDDIFRASTDKPSYISLNSCKATNLLDEASQSSDAEAKVIHKTYSYSDKFNSVYDEVATVAASKNKAAATINDNGNRFQNARTSFSAVVKTFGAGFTSATTCDAVAFPLVATSWDVDDSSQVKRTADSRFSVGNCNNNNKKRRRTTLDIRSELVLMQDNMDNYELTIHSLQRDNSILSTANSNLRSMLEQSNKALTSAQFELKASNDRADSLTFQLDEMKSEMQRAQRDLVLVRRENAEARKAVEKELHDTLQKEQEKHKCEIESLRSQIFSVEQTVEECQEVIERQAVRIVNLEVALAETTTAATDALEVAKEVEEERDLWKSRALLSPKAKSMAKYFSGKKLRTSNGKENNHASGFCSMCFKEQSGGIMRWCKCGKADCHKWAHVQCLAKAKSNVSTSVSHPGTPPPSLPLILCNGIETMIRK
jgi:predicted  nucleic acid-binding Zn-ribbon protein